MTVICSVKADISSPELDACLVHPEKIDINKNKGMSKGQKHLFDIL
jgi:hypothetical protein